MKKILAFSITSLALLLAVAAAPADAGRNRSSSNDCDDDCSSSRTRARSRLFLDESFFETVSADITVANQNLAADVLNTHIVTADTGSNEVLSGYGGQAGDAGEAVADADGQGDAVVVSVSEAGFGGDGGSSIADVDLDTGDAESFTEASNLLNSNETEVSASAASSSSSHSRSESFSDFLRSLMDRHESLFDGDRRASRTIVSGIFQSEEESSITVKNENVANVENVTSAVLSTGGNVVASESAGDAGMGGDADAVATGEESDCDEDCDSGAGGDPRATAFGGDGGHGGDSEASASITTGSAMSEAVFENEVNSNFTSIR